MLANVNLSSTKGQRYYQKQNMNPGGVQNEENLLLDTNNFVYHICMFVFVALEKRKSFLGSAIYKKSKYIIT